MEDSPLVRGIRVGDVVSATDWDTVKQRKDEPEVPVPIEEERVDSAPDTVTYSLVVRSCWPSNDVLTAFRVLEEAEVGLKKICSTSSLLFLLGWQSIIFE